jgi:hypothetical protein
MQEVKEPIVVTEGEAARLLSVSRAALRRWRREGRGPEFTRLERCVRYKTKSIEWWIAENSSGNRKACDSQPKAKAGGA